METMFEIVARCLFGSVEGAQALAEIEAAYEDSLMTAESLLPLVAENERLRNQVERGQAA